jgi:hypothetical protein
MFTARMRARYWAAMGFAAVPISVACTKGQPASSTVAQPDPKSSGTTATATTAGAEPSATESPTMAKSAPHVDLRAGASRHMPSCPNGKFCATQPAHVGADAGAPAPYAMCAASVPMPSDAGMFGSPYVSFDVDGTKEARAHDPKACCYTWVIPCPGGRPLRDENGETLVAYPTHRDDWIDRAVAEAATWSAHERDALVDRWTRDASFEHASIASFARVTLDMLALGAPASLVAGAQMAALDEVEHARIAFALASAFAGHAIGPGPLPIARQRPATLRALVSDAIAEGCINEAAAALALREEAQTASPVMRALLDRIAEDEERHAALSYATVAWAATVDAETTALVIQEELTRARSGPHARIVREIAEPCLRGLARVTASAALLT